MAIPLTQAIQETLMRDLASGVWTQTTRQFMAQIGQSPSEGGVRFLGPLLLPAGMTLLYTASQDLQVASMRLANTGLTTLQVSLYLVPVGGSPTPVHRVLRRNLTPGDHYLCPEVVGELMATGDMLYGEVATGGVIQLLATGRPIPLSPRRFPA